MCETDGIMDANQRFAASTLPIESTCEPLDFIAVRTIATLDRAGSNEKHDLFEKYIHLKHDEYGSLFPQQID